MAPLHAAVENENIEIVKLLLSNEKININLVCKIEDGYESFGKYYYEKDTVLHIAIKKKNSEIVKVLLQNKNIDVNVLFHSYDRFTETDYSCSEKSESEFYTATLILALSKDNLEIIKLLVDHKKLDVNICMKKTYSSEDRSYSGYYESRYEEVTPALYYALHSFLMNSNEFVKLLLESDKINVNTPYKKTDSSNKKSDKLIVDYPLHLAVKTGSIEKVKLLLQNKNINVNVIDSSGKKPIDYADENEKIKQLLMNYS